MSEKLSEAALTRAVEDFVKAAQAEEKKFLNFCPVCGVALNKETFIPSGLVMTTEGRRDMVTLIVHSPAKACLCVQPADESPGPIMALLLAEEQILAARKGGANA